MLDSELIALTALVNQETLIMAAENKEREMNNYAMAYINYGDYCNKLIEALQERGII
ncbi:MAG: hypothetical protein WDA42_05580 [Candidatus Bathyarchaeia archaeon]|jgi:hypothetical protein